MPVGYGSNFELPKLSLEEISTSKSDSDGGLIGLLRILFTIVEVGLSLIPGIGTAGATAIALGGAGAQTALDVASGEVTATNLGINFGSAIIPGLTSGLRALRPATLELGLVSEAGGQLSSYGRIAENLAGYTRGTEFSSNIARDLPGFTREGFVTGRRAALNTFSERFAVSSMGSTPETFQQTLKALSGFSSGVTAGAEAVEGSEEDVRRILQRAGGFSEQELITAQRIVRLSGGGARGREALLSYIRTIRSAAEARRIASELRQFAEKFIKPISDDLATAGTKNSNTFWKRYVKALKNPAGADFNDYVVQPTQAIFDASDLGRAPIEAAYKELKNAIRKEFDKLAKKFKAFKKIEDVKDAFEKAGGITVNSSVMIGYKIIEEEGPFKLIQITFDPFATGAKHKKWNGRATKNFGGKKPVYVQATDKDLVQLQVQGFSYYQKRWALNRGGAPVGLQAFGLKGLGGIAEPLLSFINTGLLRNILSLSSNVLDNVANSISGTGGWTKGWVEKFEGSFSRNWKNRVGRLFGKEVVGGAGRVFFGNKVGAFIGREAQRVDSALSQSINTAIAGKQGSFGSRFINAFKGQVGTRIATSVRGTLVRTARANGGSAVTGALSSQRKLGFVRRIPGAALTPGPQAAFAKIGQFKL